MMKLCWRRRKEAKPEGIQEIIISSQSNLSRDEQVPVIATEDEMTPEYVGSDAFKRKLCLHAQKDMWSQAGSVFHKFPDMLRIPLTACGDTALHVAVNANSVNFVNGLVNLINPEDLELQNSFGYNAFCMAVISGNDHILKIMIERNENLPMIRGCYGMLPVELAVFSGQDKIVQYLTSHDLLQRLELQSIQRLFLATIKKDMFDVTIYLFELYPAELAIARDDKELTAMQMLARKPLEEFCKKEDKNENEGLGLQLFKKLWLQVTLMGYWERRELRTRPSILLLDAVKSGNNGFVTWILSENESLTIMDVNSGENILHLAVKFRRRSIFDFILHMKSVNQLLRAVDSHGNNVLHFAARPLEQESSSLTPATKIRIDREWFKEVLKKVPPELNRMKNLDGKSPEDIFCDTHEELSKEANDARKGIAESGMLVAALVVTVAFAAALTVPGDKTNPWFTVFILANAFALFSSSASLISFLSTFTASRSAQIKFDESLTMSFGPVYLFSSILYMVIAFIAAAFLIFEHTRKWAAYVVVSLGTVVYPIIYFLLLKFVRASVIQFL